MFCHMTQNWRGRPLVSHEVIIGLIGNTRTQGGLRIRDELDRGWHDVFDWTCGNSSTSEYAVQRATTIKLHC
jgi:hypothetical protein